MKRIPIQHGKRIAAVLLLFLLRYLLYKFFQILHTSLDNLLLRISKMYAFRKITMCHVFGICNFKI